MDTKSCKFCSQSFYNTSSLENHIIGFNQDDQQNCKGAVQQKTKMFGAIEKNLKDFQIFDEFEAAYNLLNLSKNSSNKRNFR